MQSPFDELAALYEDMATWPFRRYLEIPTVLGLLGDLAGLDVLDFGCGTGMYGRWIKARGARRVVGYDVSDGMLDYARRREHDERLGLTFTCVLTPDLEAAFDIVLSVYVLPYATTPDELLTLCRQMAYPLRRGGRLIALPAHPDYATDSAYYEHYGFRLYPQGGYDDGNVVELELCRPPYAARVDAHYWSRRTLERCLRDAGCTDIAWRSHAVDAAGVDACGEAFWRNYLERPHAGIIDCRKA